MATRRKRSQADRPPVVAPEEQVEFAASAGALASPAGRVWVGFKLLVGVLVVVACSSAIAWGAYQFFVTTPRFAVQRVVVEGSHKRSEDQVLAIAGLERGQNLFSVDLARAERRLLEDPWIERARVTRRLPDALVLELSEHRAVALAALGDELFLVSTEGVPFKAVTRADSHDLPVLTGISAHELARDRQGAMQRLADGLEVLRQYARIPMSRVHVPQGVHLSDDGGATLSVGNRGMTLHLGEAPWRKKLLMAARISARLQSRGASPGILFLDNRAHPERVVVRMR